MPNSNAAILTYDDTISWPDPEHAQALRDVAMENYGILDSPPEADFDNIVILAARICDTQSAAISFIDAHRQWFKASWGLEARETPKEVSFCVHAIEAESIFTVEDARADPCFAANPLVTGPPYIRFYSGMRILAADGTPIGALCVFDPDPRPCGLTAIERSTLLVLTAQVQSLLELRRSVRERQTHLEAQANLTLKMRHLAEHDVLTGLPHRGLFHKRLTKAMRDCERTGERAVVMLVDLDHFKQINDSLGHDVGDALLCSFAGRLRRAVRATDTVARLGGDEFAVLLSGIRRDEEIAAIVKSMTKRLRRPMKHRGRVVECRASIGLATYPDDATTAEGLTKCSDLALAEAKRTRSCVRSFRPNMAKEFARETKMLSIATRGVKEKMILPYYQPKVDLGSGALVGFEALVRCSRLNGTPMLPESFAHAFEDRDLAVAIGDQMLTRVLDDVRSWTDRGLAFGHIAINSCAADFQADDFAERLLVEIDARGLNPNVIELEITEGVFLGRGSHHVARALAVLSDRGMRIALDDFGTGYASLTHLKQFPVDVLKIDRSFVDGIGKNADDTAIVRALIGLGASLGIETVAEGIESRAQAEFVKFHGCDLGQGYLFGCAQPAEAVPAMTAAFDQAARSENSKHGGHSAA